MKNKAELLIDALRSAVKTGFIQKSSQIFDFIYLHGFIHKEEFSKNNYRYSFSDYSQLSVSSDGWVEIFQPVNRSRLFNE